MNIKLMRKTCGIILAVYLIFCLLVFWIGGDNLRFKDAESDPVSPTVELGELTGDLVLSQQFKAQGDELLSLSFAVSTHGRSNEGEIHILVSDEAGQTVGECSLPAAEAQDDIPLYAVFGKPILTRRGSSYTITITSPDSREGRAISLWAGKTYLLARGEAVKEIPEAERLVVNGEPQDGILSFSMQYREHFWFGEHFLLVALLGGAALGALCLSFLIKARQGKVTFLHRVVDGFQKYSFLMRQLISRDFKTKYKRSVLGVLWSFLNPLLTMGVQYIVFSKIFKSNIPNFPLYLLSGIVCYNFFSEATTMSLVSIVGNAHLITKVYVPKYIYPVSRVLSSTINLLLSLIPLFGVMLLTGTHVTPAILMLPYGIVCLVGLCIGIGFILSTSMVFFRDTQFLWGVLIMLWMYMTPIFYPESIIPERFLAIYHCNPLYQIIHFIRVLLIDGVSPTPQSYLACLASAAIPMLLGVVIFKKNQDKFILNL